MGSGTTGAFRTIGAIAVVLASVAHADDAPSTEDLWRDACLWEVGSNAEKVPAARKALVERGEPVLDFLIPGKLETKDTLVTRALTVVVTGIGQAAVPRLVAALASPKADVRRNAADLLGALKAVDAAPAVARLLADEDARMGALSALGAMKARTAAGAIAALLDDTSKRERQRVAAAVTLGQVGGGEATVALGRHLADRSAAVRFACQFALETPEGAPTLRELLQHPDERVRLHAIAALGRIPDSASRPLLLPLLESPSATLRGFAAEALGAMKQPADAAVFRRRLAGEQDPFVKGKLAAALERAPAPR